MSYTPRTWNNNKSTNESTSDSQNQERPNPFGNMRRDRVQQTPAMSYADYKQMEKKKKEEAEKNRPLTEADFPPLGGKVVVKNTMISTTANDSITLADRLRLAIKREEDEATRRRLELEEEEKKSKEGTISLSMGPRMTMKKKVVEQKRELEIQEEDDYQWQVSTEVEPDQ